MRVAPSSFRVEHCILSQHYLNSLDYSIIGAYLCGLIVLGICLRHKASTSLESYLVPAQIWGDLKNEDWRISAGLQFDVFNPGAPTMLAFSALAGSGNSGNAWRGQFRIERFLNPSEDVTMDSSRER